METLLNDIKFGIKNIKARPVYSIIALLTLALGIGITTAMYTMVNKVLLQPLPFPESEELVLIQFTNKRTTQISSSSTIKAYEQLAEIDSPFESISFWAFDQFALDRGDRQLPLTAMITSANYMQTFGVQPIIGRWYQADDVNQQSVLISYQTWQNEFNADPNIPGRAIRLNNQEFKVLGVMPDGFAGSGYTQADLWHPIDKLERNVLLAGRLKSGLTIEQATQQSTGVQRLVNELNGDPETIWEIRYESLLDNVVGDTRQPLYLLLGSVVAVFFIAVLNVVNLTFGQYSNRVQELAVRVFVGATRKRLLRQLTSENLLLCGIGGVLGLILAAWSLEWIQAFMGSRLPRASEISIDLHTLFFILLLITVSALATSLIPASTLVDPEKLSNAIKQAGRKSTGDKQSQKVRRLLVGGEVGIAVILLICAGLLLRSYAILANQPTGFNSNSVMTGHVWFSSDYQPQPNAAAYWLELVKRLNEIPNVSKVAASSTIPMGRTGIDFPVQYSYPTAPAVERGEEPRASIRSITPGYFDALEIPIIEGREFDFTDTAESPRVVVINQKLANSNWPGENAVGNTLQLPEWLGGDHLVVGVVGNVKHRGLRSMTANEFFLPVTQRSYPGMSFIVKTNSDNTAELENMMLQTSVELEPTAPMILIGPLAELTEQSIIQERIILTILTVFAGIALVLASIGVYGVSDNFVSQRTNEIGIRMAIGAKPSAIKKWVLFDTAKPVFLGAIFGLLLAFITSQFIASVLYGVKSWDPITFISIPVILLSVGLIATWIPAHRATKVHPQEALQYE